MNNSYDELVKKVHGFDPIAYGKTRNFINGNVSQLSPYISRGAISTKEIASIIIEKQYKKYQIEKFIQELAWRDYWQKKWQELQNIDIDIKSIQNPIFSKKNPVSITNSSTKIKAIDNAVNQLYKTGYLHNHLRMYIASICCNIGNYHWLQPAKWMYYHLIDGDWGSNALSWQWVAGSNSHKKYYANQENINKYCFTKDSNTFLDKSYEELINDDSTPDGLKEETDYEFKTPLIKSDDLKIDQDLPIIIYTSYNLNINWKKDVKANRILLLEPNHFDKYPISKKVMSFFIKLANEIENIQIINMNFNELLKKVKNSNEIYFKEHPFSDHFTGIKEERDWLFPEISANGSFFNYWKKGIKEYKII